MTANDSFEDDVDELFDSFEESGGDPSVLADESVELDDEEVESRPLQFPLRALFTALTLTGFFSLAYLYQRTFGFLMFFAVAAYLGSRARRSRERAIATMFFGGGAAICGGLMMAESSRSPVAIFGLLLACGGAYAMLHGAALVVSSFWE